MPKTKRELDLEINEVLSSRSVAPRGTMSTSASSMKRLKHGRSVAPRGTMSAPEPLPKRLKHGNYIATFEQIRNAGTPDASATWKITRRGKEVGTMHEGSKYGWGHPTTTMHQLAWEGLQPEYDLPFDQGPSSSHAQALAKFSRAAERLISWRRSGKGRRAEAQYQTKLARHPDPRRNPWNDPWGLWR